MKVEIQQYFHEIKNQSDDFDIVLHHIAQARVVLMGEATHGTQEFYRTRAELAKRLIVEKGFRSIGIEGDFPDTYRINRYINFQSEDTSSIEALDDFKRFPSWMWRNEEVVIFIDWLRDYNKSKAPEQRVSIYGLDVYSLHKSIEIVIDTLEKIDPQSAQQAKEYYACFDAYKDPQEYGYIASMLKDKSCQDVVIAQLKAMKQKDIDFFKYENLSPLEEKFYIEQNALVVKNAEAYYRAMFSGDRSASWNVRDRHMMEMVKQIEIYNRRAAKDDKIILWAHNSHVGNANATQMASYGEINIGQLAKEEYGAQAVSIGFTTYTGTVSAASAWSGKVERKVVRPALQESVEEFFHNVGIKNFIAIPAEYPDLHDFFWHDDYLERAIGVIYLPETERQSHYFYAQLAKQFDIIIHYDRTHAVVPLEKTSQWQEGEDVPETFPFGL